MHIGELIDADVEAVVDLWRRCDLTRPWNDPIEDIGHARRASDATVLVGREDTTIVASVMVGFDGHRGWVYYLAVDPARQRSGFGRAMMSAAEAWLRERRAPKLQLLVRDTNKAALGFYERLGFALTQTISSYYSHSEPTSAWVFEKRA